MVGHGVGLEMENMLDLNMCIMWTSNMSTFLKPKKSPKKHVNLQLTKLLKCHSYVAYHLKQIIAIDCHNARGCALHDVYNF